MNWKVNNSLYVYKRSKVTEQAAAPKINETNSLFSEETHKNQLLREPVKVGKPEL